MFIIELNPHVFDINFLFLTLRKAGPHRIISPFNAIINSKLQIHSYKYMNLEHGNPKSQSLIQMRRAEASRQAAAAATSISAPRRKSRSGRRCTCARKFLMGDFRIRSSRSAASQYTVTYRGVLNRGPAALSTGHAPHL